MNDFIFETIQYHVPQFKLFCDTQPQIKSDTHTIYCCFISYVNVIQLNEYIIKHILKHNSIHLKLIFIDTSFNKNDFAQTFTTLKQCPYIKYESYNVIYIYEYILSTLVNKMKLSNTSNTTSIISSNIQMRVVDIADKYKIGECSCNMKTIENLMHDIFDHGINYPIIKWNSLELNNCMFDFVEYISHKFNIPLITTHISYQFGLTNINDLIEYEMFNSYSHCIKIDASITKYKRNRNVIHLDRLQSFIDDIDDGDIGNRKNNKRGKRTGNKSNNVKGVIRKLKLRSIGIKRGIASIKVKQKGHKIRTSKSIIYVSKRLKYLKHRNHHIHHNIHKLSNDQHIVDLHTSRFDTSNRIRCDKLNDHDKTKVIKFNYMLNKDRKRISNKPINWCSDIINHIIDKSFTQIDKREHKRNIELRYDHVLDNNELSLRYQKFNCEMNEKIKCVRDELKSLKPNELNHIWKLNELVGQLRSLKSQMLKFRGFEEDNRRNRIEKRQHERKLLKQNAKLKAQTMPHVPSRYEKQIIEQKEIMKDVVECKTEFSNELNEMKELMQQMTHKMNDVVNYNTHRSELQGTFV